MRRRPNIKDRDDAVKNIYEIDFKLQTVATIILFPLLIAASIFFLVVGLQRSSWTHTTVVAMKSSQLECLTMFNLVDSKRLYSYKYIVSGKEYWLNGECAKPGGGTVSATPAERSTPSDDAGTKKIYFNPSNPSESDIWSGDFYYMLAGLWLLLGILGISVVIYNRYAQINR